ncbi:hypothetical protein HDU81_003753 [Chytriomyces hyalinus]|nr:hypothetical protein HDU81_003753 [Chytriomyces hyalinus]
MTFTEESPPKYNPVQVDAEIPDEFKETPPLETTGMLDKRFDDLIAEINFMHESRGRDFQNTDARKDRLPAIETMTYFDGYKEIRQKRIDSVSKVDLPIRPESSSGKIREELDNYWTVEEEVNPKNLLPKLREFFLNKSFDLLEESSLLLSRWQRFCKTSYDVMSQSSAFIRHFRALEAEFFDSVSRIERLSESLDERQKIIKKQEALEEAARFEAEKTGLLGTRREKKNTVNKVSTLATEALKIRKASDKDAREQANAAAKSLLTQYRLGEDDAVSSDVRDCGFETSDLTLYLRGMITAFKERREIDTYITRVKTMLHGERTQLLRDYKMISSLKPGSGLLDTLNDYDGVNLFMDCPPVKTPKVEDFLTEFEILCAHYSIETEIVQEDGRPFSFEVDGRFTCKFFEQVLETNFLPYEGDPDSSKVPQSINASVPDRSSNMSHDSKSAAILNATTVLNASNVVLPNPPRLKLADWLKETTILPSNEEWLEKQTDILRQHKDNDFELMCEMDLIRCNDMETVLHRLKENSKRMWELSAKKPNSKPLVAKSSVLSKPGTKAIHVSEIDIDKTRLPQTFDLGMMLPDGRDHLSDHHVLDAKKQTYGLILKTNEEIENAEQDDPSKKSKHEVNSYFLLRFCRIRELRNTLRLQLNFFRSIEKRINQDPFTFQPSNPNLASILKSHGSNFETEESNAQKQDPTASGENKAANVTFGHSKLQEPSSEDVRLVKNGVIDVQDQKGVSIVYDVAIADLKNLEFELLKTATIYVNNGLYGRVVANASYFEDMITKKDRKSEVKDATFINPVIDRAQILLELFDAEVKYQNAKIETINCYMEVFEHSRSLDDIKRVSQIIINLLHMRPSLDFAAPYFSRDYAACTKSLKIQSNLVSEVTIRCINEHRAWVKRHYSKLEGRGERSSIIPFGLPGRPHTDGVVSMHHYGAAVHMTELIPSIAIISKIHKQANLLSKDLLSLLKLILAKDGVVGNPSRSATECVMWKGMFKIWTELDDHDFMLPLKGRKLIGGLECNDWLENPLLPDLILSEKYNPYDYAAATSEKYIPNTVAPHSMFTEPGFQPIGRDLLCRALKSIIYRNRLYFAWIETDFWKFVYEEQFPQMGLDKAEFAGRLGALNYDLPGMDNTVVEDDDFEDFDGKETNYETGDPIEGNNASSNAHYWKCGPLAICELDESFNGIFDFSNFSSIMQLLRPAMIHKASRALKLQILEKNWVMASVEINSFLLHDLHYNAMNEKVSDLKLAEKAKKTRKTGRSVNQKDRNAKQFDVDYKPFIITSILSKKKQMRKSMIIEYAKEIRNVSKLEVSEAEREDEITILRNNLCDWYFFNLKEVVMEECERAEYTNLMVDFRVYTQSFPAGRVVFRNSKIVKNKDFVVGVANAKEASKLDVERSIDTQDVYTRSLDGAERISTLWYLPHITEALLTFGTCDKISKSNTDMTTKFYHNGNVFSKSIRVQKLVMEILRCVCLFASLLCDNGRFVKSVRDLREAEYIINIMNGIKKDLLHHGTQIDFEQAEKYLSSKWELWFMRTRLALLSVGYATMMKLMPKPSAYLFLQEEIMSQKKALEKLRNPIPRWNYSKIQRRRTTQKYIPLASRYCFAKLDAVAKDCAESRIADLEDTLDSYQQATLLNFGENNDELNKNQMDYLLTRIRLFLLRKEYVNMTFFGEPIWREDQLKEFMRLYKMRVIVGAVRLYHKQGSRGNAQTPALLNDEIVKCTNEMELNRMSMSAFEKCQITTLLGELGRQYTTHLMRNARHYLGQLVDERSGKLFKVYDHVEVQSLTGERQFAFTVEEKNYGAKTLMIQGFVEDLYKAHAIQSKETKMQNIQAAAMQANGKTGAVEGNENRVFSCSKESLAKAIMKLALQVSKWGESHIIEQEHMTAGMIQKLTESLKTSEKIIANLIQDKKELQETMYHNVRLATAQAVSDLQTDLASKSVEINDLRKSRKLEEKRLRNKICEEYDDLVTELVLENHVIRNRFNEYRTNTVQEMAGIIAETKKEELVQLIESPDIPDALKASAKRTIQHDEQVKVLKDELHEINMTLLKVRTMYTIKEQSLRSSFAKKVKTLTDECKHAEEKLWDSYRNAEAREAALRKIISKNNKDLLVAETRNEMVQKQLREEQAKVKQMTSKPDRTVSARVRIEKAGSQDTAKAAADAIEKLKYYERINVEKLLQDLKEKTLIIEDLVQQKKHNLGNSKPNSPPDQKHETTTAARPKTSAPSFNRNKRSHVDDLLFQLAEKTNENEELKRRLAIFAVSPASKKAILQVAAVTAVEPHVQVERINKAVQTMPAQATPAAKAPFTSMYGDCEAVDFLLDETMSPYASETVLDACDIEDEGASEEEAVKQNPEKRACPATPNSEHLSPPSYRLNYKAKPTSHSAGLKRTSLMNRSGASGAHSAHRMSIGVDPAFAKAAAVRANYSMILNGGGYSSVWAEGRTSVPNVPIVGQKFDGNSRSRGKEKKDSGDGGGNASNGFPTRAVSALAKHSDLGKNAADSKRGILPSFFTSMK